MRPDLPAGLMNQAPTVEGESRGGIPSSPVPLRGTEIRNLRIEIRISNRSNFYFLISLK
jgi:hypothetical protein